MGGMGPRKWRKGDNVCSLPPRLVEGELLHEVEEVEEWWERTDKKGEQGNSVFPLHPFSHIDGRGLWHEKRWENSGRENGRSPNKVEKGRQVSLPSLPDWWKGRILA